MKRLCLLSSGLLVAAMLFALIMAACLPQVAAGADEEPLLVFVLAGGSNMGGHSSKIDELPRELRGEQAEALFFDGKQWIPLSPEKVKGAPEKVEGTGFGPEISFAASMSRKLKRQIGIIKHSGSGTSLASAWSPGTTDSLYGELIRKVEAARQVRPIEIAGLLMVQGSGDSKEQKKAEAYADNLRAFIQAARKDMQSPDMLFVCARLRARQPAGKYPYAALVRQAQETGSEFVDCDALAVGPDNVHYTTEGQVELGRLFADKVQLLLGKREERR